MREPRYNVVIAASLVPRFQRTPNTKTVVTAGAKVMGILLIASKMVPNWFPCVDQSIARTMMTAVATRPVNTTLLSVASGRMRLTMSIEMSVAQLLSAAAMQLMSAAAIQAARRPLSPTGTRWLINSGNIVLKSGLFVPGTL